MNVRLLATAAVVVMLALAGCKADPPDAAPTAAPPPAIDATPAPADATPAPAPEPPGPVIVAVKLLEPGAEPRQALRLAPTVGDEGKLDVEVQLDEKMRLGNRDLPNPSPPRVRLTVATKVAAVDDAVTRYEASVTEAQALDLDTAPLPAQRLMPPVLAAVRGVAVGGGVSATGRVQEAPLPKAGGGAPQVQALASSYLQALQHLASPLPDEAVGVGARWEVVQRVVSGRLRVEQTLTYELLSIDGPIVKTKVSVIQRMSPDGAAGPGLPKGARVKSFEGTGTGEKTLDLRQVLPTSAVLQLHGVAELELATRGVEPGALQVVMDALIKVGPGIDAPDLPKPAPPPPKEDEGHDHGHDHGDHGHGHE